MNVSIIIVNYNTYDLTRACIESVQKHTQGLSYEIILVDNCSTNLNPVDFQKNFPKINLIISETNIGFAKGNNLGILQAKGKYILLLNSDTLLKDNAIKITFDYLETHPKAGVVSARLVFPDGKHQSVCQRFPSIRYQLFELLRLQKLFPKRRAGKILLGSFFDNNENTTVDWIWGTYFMFRKELLAKMPDGKLDDTFFMYAEDMQWCWDIRRSGYEVHYCPDAEVIHYMGGSSANKNELIEQNNKLFMVHNYNAVHRWGIDLLNRLLKAK